MSATGPGRGPADDRSLWWSRRALWLHVTIIVVVPTFIGLFWWQVQRVRQGNTLSWAYVFEWPFFTGYAIYMWWQLVHEQLGTGGEAPSGGRAGAGAPGAGAAAGNGDAAPVAGAGGSGAGGAEDAGRSRRRQRRAAADQVSDEEMRTYNEYLAQLAARDAEEGRERHVRTAGIARDGGVGGGEGDDGPEVPGGGLEPPTSGSKGRRSAD